MKKLSDTMREFAYGCTGSTVGKWADAVALLEEMVRNHVERKYIDATPDDDYPLRILRAYRADCNSRWADNTSGGAVSNPLMIALNEMQDKRAAILDKAIAALAGKDGANE